MYIFLFYYTIESSRIYHVFIYLCLVIVERFADIVVLSLSYFYMKPSGRSLAVSTERDGSVPTQSQYTIGGYKKVRILHSVESLIKLSAVLFSNQ